MIQAALIEGSDWWAVAGFLAVLVAATVLEVRGIVRHGDHLVDTISEMYWQIRDRTGPLRAGLAVALGGFFIWLWWHFTFEGRRTRHVVAIQRAGWTWCEHCGLWVQDFEDHLAYAHPPLEEPDEQP